VAWPGLFLTLGATVASFLTGQPAPVTWWTVASLAATMLAFLGTELALPALFRVTRTPDEQERLTPPLDRYARWLCLQRRRPGARVYCPRRGSGRSIARIKRPSRVWPFGTSTWRLPRRSRCCSLPGGSRPRKPSGLPLDGVLALGFTLLEEDRGERSS
jgi:hypothetical protein